MPDFVFIDDVLKPQKEPGEVDWALDMALYRSIGSFGGNQSGRDFSNHRSDEGSAQSMQIQHYSKHDTT